MSDQWVIVRQTISNGRIWYRAIPGQYLSRNIDKAVRYPTKEHAERIVAMEQRDLELGKGRGGYRVWAQELR